MQTQPTFSNTDGINKIIYIFSAVISDASKNV